MNLEGKHQLELNYPGDGRVFLNYWDWAHGNDVICQIVDGKLIRSNYDKEDGVEISFPEFLELVEDSIKKIEIK